jgi:hypothetical protein
MIDLLDIRIYFQHKPFGTLRFLKREDGTDGVTKCLTKNVNLYDDGAVIHVTSLNNGKKIAIRCCPPKVLQGHNIFGTNNVIGLANKLIKYVLAALGLNASQEQVNAWERGEFEIQAIDITHRFAVESHPLVSRLITHLVRTTSLRFRPTPICPGIGVRMLAPCRQANWLFYDKLLEFEDKRKKEAKYLRALIGKNSDTDAIENLLRQEASMNMRAELKLEKNYLKENRLSHGSAWGRGKAKEIYFQELELLRLGVIPSVEYAKVLLDRLTEPKLRQTFIVWFHGENLSTYGNRQTLRGRQNAILNAVGIDILNDAMPLKNPPLNMADVFDADNVLPDFPEWAHQYPRVSYKGQDLPHKR